MGCRGWVGVSLVLGWGGGTGGMPTTSPSPSTAPATTTTTTTTTTAREHVGVVERAALEADVPAWVSARESATIDATAAGGLASVAPGAEVDVVLGTWCGDSRREVTRLWKAFDAAGSLPFAVR